MSAYLVLGIGTDIGKSFLVENLCKKSTDFLAIKPVCTGLNDDDQNSDPARILRAIGKELNQQNLNEISPWRFEEPCSPHFIKEEIDYEKVKKFCQQKIASNRSKHLLIEAAGGVMTPITNNKTFLDLAKDLAIPVILVSGNYLGAISHTLTATEVLKAAKIEIGAIVVNEREKEKHSVVKTIADFTALKTVELADFLKNPAQFL
jgi:dethiobiotin synthetase